MIPIEQVVHSPQEETRIFLLPPTTRDGEAVCKVLSGAGLHCAIFSSLPALCAAIGQGTAAVIVSEESLADHSSLAACVASQPVWSDLPIIILSRAGAEKPTLPVVLAQLGNVSILERPVRTTTLVSIVQSALRARERQYQVRAHLVGRKRAEEELRRSEERLRLAVQTGKLGVWELYLPTSTLTCSPLCKTNFGRAPEYPFTYADFWNSVHPEDRPGLHDAIQKCLDGKGEYEAEYRNLWPDGSVHWVLARGQVAFAPDQTPLRLIGVTLDITDRKTADETRATLLDSERAARRQAEHAVQMKDEFLATLSHELRTPLNAILGWAQILKADPTHPEDLVEGIDVIERNARAQTQIIEDLLDMSRIISGKLRLDVQPVDMAAIIQAAVDTITPAAAAKKIRIQSKVEPIAHPIAGDPHRLQQIFWNLLMNAVKFSPVGAAIQIESRLTPAHLEISVIDNGEGIDVKFLPYVFDRFRQADATTTRKYGGLGLGLAIVKQLIELHGGTVRAASKGKGLGSTFSISLPCVAIPQKTEGPVEHPAGVLRAAARTNGTIHLSGLKILVVDDEPDARMLLRRLLLDSHAEIITAASAAEGLQAVQSQHPDLLISDIGMPGEDGYTFIRRVRQLPPELGGNIPAVALTAYVRPEDRHNALQAGFQHHLAKPVNPPEVLNAIANLLHATPTQ